MISPSKIWHFGRIFLLPGAAIEPRRSLAPIFPRCSPGWNRKRPVPGPRARPGGLLWRVPHWQLVKLKRLSARRWNWRARRLDTLFKCIGSKRSRSLPLLFHMLLEHRPFSFSFFLQKYSISGRSLNHLSRRADASGNTLCCSHPLHSSTASHDLSTASFGVPRPHVALAPAAGGKSLCLDSACASAPLSGGKKCSRAWQGVEVWKRVDFQEPKGLPMIA